MLGLLVPWRLALFAPAAPAAAPAMAGSPEDRGREKESPTGLSPLTLRLRSAALCPRSPRWMAPPGLAVCLSVSAPGRRAGLGSVYLGVGAIREHSKE